MSKQEEAGASPPQSAPEGEPTTSMGAAAPTSEAAPAPETRRFPVPKRTKKRKSWLRHLAELPVLVFFAFAIAVIVKTFLVQAFFIPSGSMLPTLHVGDRVLVEKVSYRLHDPRRGDVVVFAKSVFGGARPPDASWHEDARNYLRELLGLPTGREEDYIKRVVAVGGDSIRYAGRPRRLIVNGEAVDQGYVARGRDSSSPALTSKDCKRLDMERAGAGCRVPAGRVFVMGDNRGDSEDSRVLGPVREDKIVGRAFVIIWPPGDFRGL